MLSPYLVQFFVFVLFAVSYILTLLSYACKRLNHLHAVHNTRILVGNSYNRISSCSPTPRLPPHPLPPTNNNNNTRLGMCPYGSGNLWGLGKGSHSHHLFCSLQTCHLHMPAKVHHTPRDLWSAESQPCVCQCHSYPF